jgi:zinc protease
MAEARGEEIVMIAMLRSTGRAARTFAGRACAAAGIVVLLAAPAAAATKIERIVSPRGIEAWLVREASVPLVAVDFAFRGGSSQDPDGKPGVTSMMTDLLDEGAGNLDSRAFRERAESHAIGISFNANRDQVTGSLRTLVENQDKAVELLRLALTSPRFDEPAVERVRSQMLSALRRASTSPNDIATRTWWRTAFRGHPYAQPVGGTLDSVPAISADDLKRQARRLLARDNLKIGIVGNIDNQAAGEIVDRIFGDLPEKAEVTPVAKAMPQGIGEKVTVELDVPQTVMVMGRGGIMRGDPDFMAAYVLNHILGGGAFSSRLYREVREVRGLVYSVYSAVYPLDHTALFMSGTATRADRAGQTLDVMEHEFRRMAEQGPTEAELDAAKSYLKGSYALRFDTSSKIASMLVQLQVDDLGIDYIVKRNGLVDAVTLADVKRVAKRLLEGGMLVSLVGRTEVASGTPGGAAAPTIPAKREPDKRHGG